MGARYRTRKAQPGYLPPGGIVARQEDFTTAPQDNMPIIGGSTDQLRHRDAGFPGAYEIQHVMAQWRAADYPSLQSSVKDNIDYEVGGQRGLVDGVPYSLGVVSSDRVENFELTGQQAIIRRPYSQHSTGPVGTSDHNAFLAMAYAQSRNMFYPGEAAQADVIAAL